MAPPLSTAGTGDTQMEKIKSYYGTRFPVHVVEEAHNLFLSKLPSAKRAEPPNGLTVRAGDESWDLDTREEFLAECGRAEGFTLDHIDGNNRLRVHQYTRSTAQVAVRFPSRADIEDVFRVFERNLDASKVIAARDPIKVFIGHGGDAQWRDLKDHLHEQHGLDVVAYEIGPRAGLSVKDVLEGMLNESSLALLVLTGEDEHVDGELHARQNVVHELGLFQGRLGFTRAIALLEDGVNEFSNILGVNQIRFPKGRIRETFGDVLATIKREFDTRAD